MDTLSDIKSYIEEKSQAANFRQNLLFCLWCIRIVPRSYDDRWRSYTEVNLPEAIDDFRNAVHRYIFLGSGLEADYCQSVLDYFDALKVDEDLIDDEMDEYALEVMLQILGSCCRTCKFVIHNKSEFVVGNGLDTLTFVDLEPVILGTIPFDDSKVRALVILMKHVWERILRDEVDQTSFETLLPAIPLGNDYSWSVV